MAHSPDDSGSGPPGSPPTEAEDARASSETDPPGGSRPVVGHIQANGGRVLVIGRDQTGTIHVGDDIYQNGLNPELVRRTARVLVGLLAAAIALSLAVVGYRVVTAPHTMPGDLRLAVAQFNTQGPPPTSSYGADLSDWAGRTLADQYQADRQRKDPYLTGLTPDVWYPGLDPFAKRLDVRLGPLSDEVQAPQLLTSIGAEFLVYGTLGTRACAAVGSPTCFQPAFFVGNDMPEDAEDIVGPQQLGRPIPVWDLNASGLDAAAVKRALLIRLEVLSRFAVALTRDQRGDNQGALDVFRAMDTGDEFSGWQANEGRELLYLFTGREEAALGHDALADTAFRRALEIRPDFARARIGIGNLAYGRAAKQCLDAQRTTGTCSAALRRQAPDIGMAVDEYRQAISMAVAAQQDPARSDDSALQLSSRDWEARGRNALANAYILEAQALLDSPDAADQDRAVAELTSADAEAQAGIAAAGAQSHRSLAYSYYAEAQVNHLIAQARMRQNRESDAVAYLRAAVAAYEECRAHVAAAPSQHALQGLAQNYCLPAQDQARGVLRELGEPGQ